jgi:hypothetical protein
MWPNISERLPELHKLQDRMRTEQLQVLLNQLPLERQSETGMRRLFLYFPTTCRLLHQLSPGCLRKLLHRQEDFHQKALMLYFKALDLLISLSCNLMTTQMTKIY